MTTINSTKPLRFVPGLHYECTGCGKCCQNDWAIPVSPAKAESVRDTQLFQQKTRDGYTPLKVAGDGFILGRRAEGSCVFLAADQLCELHKELGPDSKPLTCQLFPLNLVETPDGFHVSLSFACPAVLAGVGPSIEQNREWLTDFVVANADIPSLIPTPARVPLSGQCEISYSEYLELECILIQCLDDSLCPQGLINWACTLLESGSKFQTAEYSPLRVSNHLNEALGLLDTFGRTVVGIMELADSPMKRESYIEALRTEGGERSNRLSVAFPSFSLYRPPSEVARSVTVKFMRSQFAGKRLLTGSSVVSRLLAFGTGLTVLWYYLEAQAREAGTLHFSFTHLENAFALVEENILTHSDDLEPYFDYYEEALSRMITA